MITDRPRRDTRDTLLVAAQRIFGAKGYAGVGINEVLSDVGVPKGSFYHYFSSKDAFGEAVLERYFEDYLTDLNVIMSESDQDWAARLMSYWAVWRATQSLDDCQGRCLAVKLGAEVADLSELMRLRLKSGTTAIVDQIERAIVGGAGDGSLSARGEPRVLAQGLYELWLGASVLTKLHRSIEPMDSAEVLTRQLLGITSS